MSGISLLKKCRRIKLTRKEELEEPTKLLGKSVFLAVLSQFTCYSAFFLSLCSKLLNAFLQCLGGKTEFVCCFGFVFFPLQTDGFLTWNITAVDF